jgi:hypothetical protein
MRMVRKDKVLDFETARESDRRCDFVGCKEHGLYKAPKSREQLNEYFWFCMDHIRAYNRSWNYYRGMDELELEAEIRNDTVWRFRRHRTGRGSPARTRNLRCLRAAQFPYNGDHTPDNLDRTKIAL